MKKKYLLGGVCILGLCIVLGVGIVSFFHTSKNEGNRSETSEQAAIIIEDDFVIIGEDQEEVPLAGTNLDTEQSYAVLQEMLSYVPANVLNRFYADNWGFSLTTDNLSDRFYGGAYTYVRAVTERQTKTVWMAQNDEAIRLSAIHELGHYVDLTLGWPHESDDFTAIFRNEKYSFTVVNGSTEQASTSPVEYFAEAFQETILHPENVQEHAPRTYAYMSAIINNFK